jgi:amino acid permease
MNNIHYIEHYLYMSIIYIGILIFFSILIISMFPKSNGMELLHHHHKEKYKNKKN